MTLNSYPKPENQMRRKIIAGNWKMNTTHDEAQKLASEVVHMVIDEVQNDALVVLCTPYVHLSSVKGLLPKGNRFFLGAQNCSQHDSGAYTGEISAAMLKSYGVDFVILGHSERREYFKESNAELAQKVDQVLKNGMEVIFCCGEVLAEREAGTQNQVVATQLAEGLFHLSAEQIAKVVIAYEPVWAIGTGKTASSEQAQEMQAYIRSLFAGKYGAATANNITIQYGGSMKPGNANELLGQPDVDGGLIGGAALKSRDFVDIIKGY